MKKVSELQELLYGAEPQLQREMLTLWVEEIIDEVRWQVKNHNYTHGQFELWEKIDNIEKQLKDEDT